MITNDVLRNIIIPVLFVIVLLFLSAAGLIFSDLLPSESLWQNHYTLLVPEEIDPSAVVEHLAEGGFQSVLAETTGLVSYNAVVGMQAIPVSQIHTRFESVDPRLDPYMARLPAYFHTLNGRRPMRIYYIESEGSALRVFARISSALTRVSRDFVLVEWGFYRAALLLCAYAGYVLLLILRVRADRVAVLAAGTLWVPWIVAGTASTFIVGCLFLFVYSLWLEELCPVLRAVWTAGKRRETDVRRLAVRSGFGVVVVGGIVVALLTSGRDGFAALGFAGAGSLVVAGGLAYYYRLSSMRRDHAPFEQLDILRPTLWEALRGRTPSPALSIAPFVLLPLLVLAFLPKTHSPFVPEPKSVAGVTGFNRGSLELLWTHEEQEELPNFSDYVAHRAYQEGFLYGATYAFPDGRLEMARFRLEDGRMTRWGESVAVYDEEWYASSLVDTLDPSVSQLLIDQNRPVSVVFTPVAVIFAREATLPGHFALILLVFAPFVVSFTPAVSLGLLFRGKRQEA